MSTGFDDEALVVVKIMGMEATGLERESRN